MNRRINEKGIKREKLTGGVSKEEMKEEEQKQETMIHVLGSELRLLP